MILLRLARRLLAPRVPEDEEREDRKCEEHAEHGAEERARVHVRVRADEAERGDGDGEGEDRPEGSARRHASSVRLSSGAETEVFTLRRVGFICERVT